MAFLGQFLKTKLKKPEDPAFTANSPGLYRQTEGAAFRKSIFRDSSSGQFLPTETYLIISLMTSARILMPLSIASLVLLE